MEKQITIIIPTYNMENYIGKCLDSLLIPELELVEVLVVNDGSKDNSSQIAHQYADKYPHSIKVINKENGNYGSCINTALPLASGRYIKVLDADDTFDTPAFSKFVNELSNFEEDVIVTNFIRVDEDGHCIEQSDFHNIELSHGFSRLMTEVMHTFFNHYVPMHRLTYKTSLFKSFDYHQTEGVSYTDTQWAIIPLSYCRTVYFMDICLYRYLFGRAGQTMDSAILRKSSPNLLKVLGDIAEYYEKYKQGIVNWELLQLNILELHNGIYRSIMGYGPDYFIQIAEYEKTLKIVSPEIYDLIGQIPYDPLVKYKIFKQFRYSEYDHNFTIPKIVLIELSIKYRLQKFMAQIR